MLLAITAARTDADAAVSAASFPAWAYAWDPQFKPQPATDVPRCVPGSAASYSVAQARDLFFSPDWHPESHPVMPAVVARGRKPSVRACGCCHRAEGAGGPENASLAGLSAAYIVQQMADFKSGGAEILGQRIIEMPVDVEQFELRDSRAQFRAYVPVGSVARGASLVKSGGAGNALPCASCTITSMAPVPARAAR